MLHAVHLVRCQLVAWFVIQLHQLAALPAQLTSLAFASAYSTAQAGAMDYSDLLVLWLYLALSQQVLAASTDNSDQCAATALHRGSSIAVSTEYSVYVRLAP
eukprot:12765-Heterococcus_DN1.PRE.1